MGPQILELEVRAHILVIEGLKYVKLQVFLVRVVLGDIWKLIASFAEVITNKKNY